jgi:hypothetical protein
MSVSSFLTVLAFTYGMILPRLHAYYVAVFDDQIYTAPAAAVRANRWYLFNRVHRSLTFASFVPMDLGPSLLFPLRSLSPVGQIADPLMLIPTPGTTWPNRYPHIRAAVSSSRPAFLRADYLPGNDIHRDVTRPPAPHLCHR